MFPPASFDGVSPNPNPNLNPDPNPNPNLSPSRNPDPNPNPNQVVMADVLEHLLDLPLAIQQARPHTQRVCTACAVQGRCAAHCMCTAWCTACALHVHFMCTACALHVHCMRTACALRNAPDPDPRP